jgi:hypothetical protein
MPNEHFFSAISWREQVTFDEMMMMVCALCTKPTRLEDFYSARLLKQHSAGRHVAPLKHI